MRTSRCPLAFIGIVYFEFGCAGGRVTASRRLWPPEELAALSEGAGSSFTSGLGQHRRAA